METNNLKFRFYFEDRTFINLFTEFHKKLHDFIYVCIYMQTIKTKL